MDALETVLQRLLGTLNGGAEEQETRKVEKRFVYGSAT